jgi:MYXO-CTERM domain-containing protein
MRGSIAKLFVGALVALSPVLASTNASAGIESCGNIEVSAKANCVLETSGGCTARCTPISVQAACSAELYVECSGQCSAKASVDCSASCKADCSAQCTVDPGSLECGASCQGRCDGKCDAYCAADANGGECRAKCKATCGGECDASCTGTPPEASCDAKCEASCSGSCEAEANFKCQVDCQSGGFAECTVETQGGCEAQCQQPDGALFCDGDYVDAGDRLKECMDYLEGVLKIDVEGYASASGECRGNTCQGEAEAGVSCSAAPARTSPWNLGALGGAALGLGILVARRRRRG